MLGLKLNHVSKRGICRQSDDPIQQNYFDQPITKVWYKLTVQMPPGQGCVAVMAVASCAAHRSEAAFNGDVQRNKMRV